MALSVRGFEKFKVIALFAALCLFLLSADGYTAQKQKKVSAGAVVAWKGSVYIERASDKKVTIKRQETVYEGDTVVTEEGGRVKLLMKDDTVLSLGEKTSIKMEGYSVDSAKNERVANVKMSRGIARSVVGRFFGSKGSSFNVSTVTSVAGVKGTQWIMVMDENGSTKVVGLSGTVVVGSSDPNLSGTVDVNGGMQTDVAPGQAPTTPVAVSEEYLKQILGSTDVAITVEEDVEEIVQVSEGTCISCHEPVVSNYAAYAFPHPEAVESCAKCHIKAIASKPITINILTPAEKGMALLDLKKDMFYNITLGVRGASGEDVSTSAVPFGPKMELKSLENDGKAPVISNVRVTEVKAGMFFSAVVEWDTDEPAASKVDYGTSDKFGSVARNSSVVYLNRHRITLERLKSGTTYLFAASSQDVFGNNAVAETVKLSIDKEFANKEEAAPAGIAAISVAEMVGVGEKILVRWEVSALAKVAVSMGEDPNKKPEGEPHYPGFKKDVAIGSDICNECHGGGSHKQTAHPIGPMKWMSATKNEKLPYDAYGNIMCSTCHPGHGGQFVKMLRDEESLLCDSCHNK